MNWTRYMIRKSDDKGTTNMYFVQRNTVLDRVHIIVSNHVQELDEIKSGLC